MSSPLQKTGISVHGISRCRFVRQDTHARGTIFTITIRRIVIDLKVTYVLLEVNRRTLKQRPHEFMRVPGHGIGSVNDRVFFYEEYHAHTSLLTP